ncbi:MAG: MBL fold metallo-hydrolase [Deltaproteobacteria bacterium]|nr:MBL fold metallo-hydrolase [Deltaproteobacteria bacterium]
MTKTDDSKNTNKGKVEAVQVIQVPDSALSFVDPREDVHVARLPIAGCGWVDTDDGVVLIDTLLSVQAAERTLAKIHEISGQVKYIIYTHGHLDHIGGCQAFMADKPLEVIASKYLPDRLEKFKMLAPHRARIAAQQFNLPEIPSRGDNWVYPTKTFLGEMSFSLGGKTFELHTARAETDDVCWVWIPEIKTAFLGDLILRSFPNIGNPWKPTRFALDWAKTLEQIRAKNPELIFGGGTNVIYHGQEALEVLDINIEAIRSLHDQVVKCINQDMHITEMIHEVDLPEHLKESPYLRYAYSRPEFFVFNVYCWYHGYFDHNPANLLPRPQKEVSTEIFNLIGEPEKIIKRAGDLLEEGQAQLGLQVLDVLIQAHPENTQARQTRLKLLEEIGSNDSCLMSRNAWAYFIDKDREFLEQKGEL